MTITVLVTDRQLNVIGDPITQWTELHAILRFNEPGSGYFIAPARPEVMEQLDAGHRIVVIRDGDLFCAGPYEVSRVRRSASESGAPPGTVTVHWADDLASVVGRVVYPTPSEDADGAQGDYWSVANTNAEVAMRALVDANAGPNALSYRRVPRLVLGELANVGTNVTYRTRWAMLGDALREIALAGGGLGFRTRQIGDQIYFEVYQPRDLTGAVRFSWGLGNLREVDYERRAPTATSVIVGAQGDLDARTIVERTNTAAESAWGRLETFLDRRDSDDPDELVQAGDAELVERAETAQLSTVTIDTPDQRFGADYGLGDLVTVVPLPGVEVAEVVRSAHLEATPSEGEQVTVLVGSQAASSDPVWVQYLRRLDRRLARLETNVTTETS